MQFFYVHAPGHFMDHVRRHAVMRLAVAPSPPGGPAQTDYKSFVPPTSGEWSKMTDSVRDAYIKSLRDSPEYKVLQMLS